MWDTIRKFGLDYCDLPTQIWNAEVMLRVLSVKIQRHAKPIAKFFYVLTTVCVIMYIFNYQVFMFCFVFIGCRETGDTLAGILVLSIGMNSSIVITKLLYMYKYQDKIQTAVAGYIAYDQFPVAPKTADLLAVTLRNVKKRALLFWAVTMGNGFAYGILNPIVMPSSHMLYDDHIRFGLKLIFGITNYQVAIANIVTCVNFVCFAVSNITGLLVITIGYSEARLLALSQELRTLWSDAQGYYRENFDADYSGNISDYNAKVELNKYVKQRLQVIAKSHAINIDLVKKIEYIYRDAVAIEFILISIGLITDLLGGLEQTYISLPFAAMQVSMDCFVGQRLMDASVTFEDAVYDSKWENFDATNRKTVVFILNMAQRTLTLSAGGVATLSFDCLMGLFRGVYSAYTALRSTMM